MDRGLVVGLAAGAGIGFAVCYYLVSKDNINNNAKLAAPEQQKQQQQKETESRNISAVVSFFFDGTLYAVCNSSLCG